MIPKKFIPNVNKYTTATLYPRNIDPNTDRMMSFK